MKMKMIGINLLCLLYFSCVNNVQSKDAINNFLTNGEIKLWSIKYINERKLSKDKIIWRFNKNGSYHIFSLEKETLILLDNGDEIYTNKFEIISNRTVHLNDYPNDLLFISDDSLVFSNNNYRYILKPFILPTR